ncbi:Dihydrolipoyllysine-residue succinyltransferase component of 2-oxoglutarate dehydrogenase complex [Pirellulimonas nuda]|uniref:Dihydrolipoyllysine-residue succinyltransferase component of 2-oxoglutarate dehydrogenase complex n=1 Tax=Pirellulimonas nuda TaxID=2528009 RepID=A0A518D7S3_9BACT|nr:2-oxoglutarate dehydrogenase complex dihydrolipoyllysine-residue succinyltransferase [Pirellulimonas nuda]QDU87524.1 Dihydrolipoyllysine-residue succinyltransferase component of 2-oxoglutarate dehydrogenase complex [Pirellulimonas nuda]
MAAAVESTEEEVVVPEVGESISEVVIGQWHKQEGDSVGRDEEIVELESEKATFEAPAPVAGVLRRILKQSGDTAQVGEVIALIERVPGGGGSAAPAASTPPAKSAPAKPPKAERAPAPKQPEPKQTGGAEPAVMPAAARLLAENDLDAGQVEATGPGGRLLKEDVLRHIAAPQRSTPPAPQKSAPPAPASKPAPAVTVRHTPVQNADAREERRPMTPLRRRIAARLVEAQKTAALLTTFNEADMSAIKQLRKEHGDAFEKRHGVRLGFMGFFVKAAVEALKSCPELNARIDGDELVYQNFYDIGIAIGIEGGLVVPVLRDADRLSFADIERSIEDFAGRARKGQLKVDEMMGGTFTISNGGIYGSLLSTPIVNPPQSGVLGMHTIQERPIALNGQVVIRPMMYLALTYDHRIVDGKGAVTFLKQIKQAIEEPARMLIEV